MFVTLAEYKFTTHLSKIQINCYQIHRNSVPRTDTAPTPHSVKHSGAFAATVSVSKEGSAATRAQSYKRREMDMAAL